MAPAPRRRPKRAVMVEPAPLPAPAEPTGGAAPTAMVVEIRPPEPSPSPPTEATATPTTTTKPKPPAERPPPFLLDFYPLQDPSSTRLSEFFVGLRAGRLRTTRCTKDGLVWPPRTVCPKCHTESLQWTDLPGTGRLYAFSAVLAGAPLGMEADVPFVVALVDLDGEPLRLFGRVVGTPWNECHIGQPVQVEPYELPDGRWFYRFRTTAP